VEVGNKPGNVEISRDEPGDTVEMNDKPKEDEEIKAEKEADTGEKTYTLRDWQVKSGVDL
ncbi:MAG: hypothetical protein J6X23_00970, partial [Bacteroidaceae bacterium]|nr:hypothetical protein [Bacteroidaceae bacterium]